MIPDEALPDTPRCPRCHQPATLTDEPAPPYDPTATNWCSPCQMAFSGSMLEAQNYAATRAAKRAAQDDAATVHAQFLEGDQ